MTSVILIGLSALFLLAAVPALGTGPALLAANKMLLVDGEPTFIIGLYEHPKSDIRLQEAVGAGFNLIQCPPDVAALDRVHRLGAKAWINTGYALDLSEDTAKRKAELTEMVRKFGSHPAMLVWEGPDEALWNCWYGTMQALEPERSAMREEMERNNRLRTTGEFAMQFYDTGRWKLWEEWRKRFWEEAGKPIPVPSARMDTAEERASKMGAGFTQGCRFLRALDPSRFIWLNHAPRNTVRALREHNRAVDMAGCDIYPIPGNLRVGHSDLPNTQPSSVGDYTDRMREAAPGKACAMVLQGFGWRDLQEKPSEAEVEVGIGRRPTLNEQRFMAWNAIAHGANAILYWGTAYVKEPESDEARAFWNDLLAVAREIHTHRRFVAAPSVMPEWRVRVEEHYASNDGTGVRVMLKKVESEYLLIVVNEKPYGVTFTVSGLPAALDGRGMNRVGGGPSPTAGGRAFTDGIKAYEVRLYKPHGR
ncbi:MAG: hypothetical protein FJX72_09200 [Armatimonadetes bacterium]|nr:hypothetical protein [Armatimonadota bacterium]